MFNVTLIGTLGGPNSRVFAINLGRQLAGDSNAPPNSDNHTMFFDGGAQDLGVLVLSNPFGLPTIPIFNLSTSRALGAFPAGAPIVAGFSSLASFPSGVISRATFWASNTINDMGTLIPGPAFPGMFLGTSEAHGANNQGLIVGVSDIAVPLGMPALQRGFVFDASTLQMQMLPTLSPDPTTPGDFLGNSKALGINDLGQIVGVADTDLTDPTGNPIRHAFLFDMRTQQIQDLGTLISRLVNPSRTDTNSEARAINNRGQMVGVSDSLDMHSAVVQRAFLFDPGSFSGQTTMDLGTLDPANRPQRFFRDLGSSEANAINNRGAIVGSADIGQIDANGESIRHGFLLDGTPDVEDLNDTPLPLGFTTTAATGINDNGDICGFAVDAAGTMRGLLLVP